MSDNQYGNPYDLDMSFGRNMDDIDDEEIQPRHLRFNREVRRVDRNYFPPANARANPRSWLRERHRLRDLQRQYIARADASNNPVPTSKNYFEFMNRRNNYIWNLSRGGRFPSAHLRDFRLPRGFRYPRVSRYDPILRRNRDVIPSGGLMVSRLPSLRRRMVNPMSGGPNAIYSFHKLLKHDMIPDARRVTQYVNNVIGKPGEWFYIPGDLNADQRNILAGQYPLSGTNADPRHEAAYPLSIVEDLWDGVIMPIKTWQRRDNLIDVSEL